MSASLLPTRSSSLLSSAPCSCSTKSSFRATANQLTAKSSLLGSTSPSTTSSLHSPSFIIDNNVEGCDERLDGMIEDSVHDFDLLSDSHELPSSEQLEKAARLPVYDANGNSRTFKSLYHGDEYIGQRQLFIFVRHFYCGLCQAYVHAIKATFPSQVYFSLTIPTTITVIGCGSPELIPRYILRLSCPFRVFVDPTRRIYKALGMSSTTKFGSKPQYLSGQSALGLFASTVKQMVFAPKDQIFRSGDKLQIGGEFLFENGRPVWCHRMQNFRDHTEIEILKKVLEMEERRSSEKEEVVTLQTRSSIRFLRRMTDPIRSRASSRGRFPHSSAVSVHREER